MGAARVAEYVLMKGVKPIRKDRQRHKAAMELTVHVLGLYAAIEHEAAEKADAEEPLEDDEPSTTE
jgi:hypothetical protein